MYTMFCTLTTSVAAQVALFLPQSLKFVLFYWLSNYIAIFFFFFFFMNPRSHQSQVEFTDSRAQVSRHVRYHLHIVLKPVEYRLFLQISHLRRGKDTHQVVGSDNRASLKYGRSVRLWTPSHHNDIFMPEPNKAWHVSHSNWHWK